MQSEAYVELKNINKNFGDFAASDDVSFSIEKGKLIGLLGPSGSGKTTILRMLAGLENADSGDIYIDGRLVNDVPASERKIGFVFQNYALFRYKTVYDNIAFGMKIQKFPKSEIRDKVDELIELVGLKGLEKRYPRQLSGGQRQSVAFARALATSPQLLLLDEPFAAIDAKVRKELRAWLRELINQVGITSIFVTHDQDEAVEVADEIIITNHGRIEQIGTPADIYNDPKTEFVAQFLGQPTVIDEYTGFKGFHGAAWGTRAILRPEFVNVYKEGEVIPYPISTEKGVVKRTSFRGSVTELVIHVNGVYIVAHRQLGQPAVAEGEQVAVFVQKMFLTRAETASRDDHGEENGQNARDARDIQGDHDDASDVRIEINEALRNAESVII